MGKKNTDIKPKGNKKEIKNKEEVKPTKQNNGK